MSHKGSRRSLRARVVSARCDKFHLLGTSGTVTTLAAFILACCATTGGAWTAYG